MARPFGILACAILLSLHVLERELLRARGLLKLLALAVAEVNPVTGRACAIH